MTRVRIVYDGQCPFCSRYARLMRLREKFDVELVDARQQPAIARTYGLNLNEGMIVDIDGAVHHGSAAVWVLSGLSSRIGFWNRLMAQLFASRRIAAGLYPVMRLGRRITLLAIGRKPL